MPGVALLSVVLQNVVAPSSAPAVSSNLLLFCSIIFAISVCSTKSNLIKLFFSVRGGKKLERFALAKFFHVSLSSVI